MAIAQARDLDAFDGVHRNVRHIHIEYRRAPQRQRQRCRQQTLDDLSREVRTGFEMALGIATQSVGLQRDGDGRLAEEAPLRGRGHRARIQHIVAQVRAIVDARHHHVRLERKQSRDCQVHAVGGRALHVVHVGLGLRHAQRNFERE